MTVTYKFTFQSISSPFPWNSSLILGGSIHLSNTSVMSVSVDIYFDKASSDITVILEPISNLNSIFFVQGSSISISKNPDILEHYNLIILSFLK